MKPETLAVLRQYPRREVLVAEAPGLRGEIVVPCVEALGERVLYVWVPVGSTAATLRELERVA